MARLVPPSCGLCTAVTCLALGGLSVLGGCSKPPSESYFPLEAGHRWTYRVSSEWENGTTEREEFTLSNEGSDRLERSGSTWRRHSDSGVDYWLKSDEVRMFECGYFPLSDDGKTVNIILAELILYWPDKA